MARHGDWLRRVRRLTAWIVAIVIIDSSGCSIFPPENSADRVDMKKVSLPPIQAARDAIQLEVLFVERVTDDPAVGSRLWREIDQIAATSVETRESLAQNGFRVGHVGSNLPSSVQSLLGLNAGQDEESNPGRNKKPLIGNLKVLPPGVDSEIQTAEAKPTCEFTVHEGSKSKLVSYQNARTVLRIKSTRLQDGWVRIDFQPEIHHGQNRARPTPTSDGWAQTWRQNIDSKYAHQFSLTMNVGELAIITCEPDNPDTLGSAFFCRDDDGIAKQRVLVIRVAASGNSDARLH